MNLKTVTITGADDSIPPEDLVSIQEKYPFVEWGILLSQKQMGNKRFPSLKWLKWLNELYDINDLKLSGHLCGKFVRDLALGNNTFKDMYPELWNIFDRIQLNFHAEFTPYNDKFIDIIAKEKEKKFIIQMDGVNNVMLHELLYFGGNVQALFDVSGGTGVVPAVWPKPISGVFCGYAGGLGPNNLAEQLEKINELVGEASIWVDMETKVRSNDDKLFDLYKVNTCLEISAKIM